MMDEISLQSSLAASCEPLYPPGSPQFFQMLAGIVFCILSAATAAGLTLVTLIISHLVQTNCRLFKKEWVLFHWTNLS